MAKEIPDSFKSVIFLGGFLFYHLNRPVIDLRESPSSQSKVASQAIFSEKISIEREENGWSFASTPDGYTGWIPTSALVPVSVSYAPNIKISRLMAHIYHLPKIEYGPLITLPYSAALMGLDQIDTRWTRVRLPDEREAFVQNGDIAPESVLQKQGDLVQASFRFLGLPYTWGGRSSFGYDCSGFVQMLYSRIGIELRRDARQQVLDPRFQSIPIEALEPGDLVFFGKSEKEIKHVGMLIEKEKFIHTSSRERLPWCRISKLSDPEWSGEKEAYFPYRIFRKLQSYTQTTSKIGF